MLDLGTAVAYISLDLTAFNTGVETVVSSLNGMQDMIAGQSFSWSDFFVDAGKAATNFGGELTRGVTLPLVDFGKSAVDSFIEYESAFTGVKKTLDVGNRSAKETEELYNQLSDAIQEMSTRTASSASEIAAVAEIAGQLGISAEDLMKFTEVMVMLGDTTNLTSETAAESLAKFINITGTSKDDIDRLGASIVDLGNHFATNESDIVLMSTRLASAGTIAGLTERDILALSTAMSSVGIRAEAGGSAMSQTLAQIEKAVQMSIAGDEGAIEMLNTLATVSGMSAEEFSSAWMKDPMTALTNFLYGLGQLDENGQSTVLILDELGMTGIRQANMLKALGLASEVLADATETSNKAWEENTALTNEANLRYGTLESQISQLNEEWEIMKRDIAEILLPILQQLMDALRDLIGWWKGLSDDTKESIVQFLEFAAVVGPILMIVGKLSTGLGLILRVFEGMFSISGSVIGFFQGLSGHVAGFAGAAEQAGEAMETSVGLLGKIGSAFTQHIAPILKVLGGVTSVIAGIVMAISSFFDMWNNGFSMAKEAVMLLGLAIAAVGAVILGAPATVAAVIAGIIAVVATLVIVIKDHWEEIKQAFSDGMKAIGEFLSKMWDGITDFFSGIGETVGKFFSDTFKGAGEFFKNLLSGAVDFFANMVKSAIAFFQDIFDGTNGFIGNVIDAVLTFFGNILRNLGEWFGSVISNVGSFFGTLIGNAGEFFGNMLVNVGEFLVENAGAIGEFFGNMLIDFGEFTKNIMSGFGEFVGDVFGKLGSFISDAANAVGDFFGNMFEKSTQFFAEHIAAVSDFFFSMFSEIGGFFGNLFRKIGEWLNKIHWDLAGWLNNVIGWIGSFGGSFFNAGWNLLSGFWDGLKSVWNSLVGWVVDKFGWLSDFVGNVWSFVTGNGWNGSHANGLDYVPYDGYIAQLHQGERVLTKAEAKEYNDGGSQKGGDTFNFYNTKPDPYEYARQMKRAKREMAF